MTHRIFEPLKDMIFKTTIVLDNDDETLFCVNNNQQNCEFEVMAIGWIKPVRFSYFFDFDKPYDKIIHESYIELRNI